MKHIVMILTAPSCSGKSTLEAKLDGTGNFTKAISVTTRPMRPGEQDGVDYHFISMDNFLELEGQEKLIESVTFNNNRYGVTKEEVERHIALGKHTVVVCEPHGAEQYRQYAIDNDMIPINIFVQAPLDVCAGRFFERLTNERDLYINNEVNPEIIERYANRMALLMTEEQTWKNQFPYDLITPVMINSPETDVFFDKLLKIANGDIPEKMLSPKPYVLSHDELQIPVREKELLKDDLVTGLTNYIRNELQIEQVGKAISSYATRHLGQYIPELADANIVNNKAMLEVSY